MIKDWSKATTYIGVGAIGLGFLLIFLAWNGAAGIDYAQGQLPYLISGGVGGLALVFVGGMVLVLQNARRDRAAVTKHLEELNASFDKVSRNLAFSADGKMSVNGLVLAGATSFHNPDCRLVKGRSDAERLPREEAEERGLSPCRICKP